MARGEFKDAVERFTAAWAVFGHPLIAKKRAESHEKLSEFEEAVADYRLYLSRLEGPKKPERKLIEERIQALEALLMKPVAVTIVASRAGVMVSVDNAAARRTPFDIHLVPGLHSARIDDARFVTNAKEVRVPAGRTSVVELEAVARTGSVVIAIL